MPQKRTSHHPVHSRDEAEDAAVASKATTAPAAAATGVADLARIVRRVIDRLPSAAPGNMALEMLAEELEKEGG